MIVFEEFETKTGGRFDALDITEDVREIVTTSGVERGYVLVFSPHTTCSVFVGNGRRDLADKIENEMGGIAPPNAYYAHDDLDIRTENLVENEPANAPAHIYHVFSGSAFQRFNIEGGRPELDDGSRVVFVELDCSRLRRYFIQVVGE